MANPLVGKKPVTTTDPITAAQHLRIILHELTVMAEGGSEDDGEDHYDENGDLIENSHVEASPWIDEYNHHSLFTKLSQIRASLVDLRSSSGALTSAKVAAEDRRMKPGLEAIETIRKTLITVETLALSAGHIVDELPTYPPQNGLPADRLRKAYELAQCLPTVADVPKDAAENTLRAIIALLRNHNWPGSEQLTQLVKEVNGDGAQDGNDEGKTEANPF